MKASLHLKGYSASMKAFALASRKICAVVLTGLMLTFNLPAQAATANKPDFEVENADGPSGSLSVPTGAPLRLTIKSDRISIYAVKLVEDNTTQYLDKQFSLLREIDPTKVTGLSYASEQHHRIVQGAVVGLVSLGAGLIVMTTKTKQHYVGMTWNNNGEKVGVALRVDKSKYREIIQALEAVTGQKCVDQDTTVAKKLGIN
jgi:hypothetical protein